MSHSHPHHPYSFHGTSRNREETDYARSQLYHDVEDGHSQCSGSDESLDAQDYYLDSDAESLGDLDQYCTEPEIAVSRGGDLTLVSSGSRAAAERASLAALRACNNGGSSGSAGYELAYDATHKVFHLKDGDATRPPTKPGAATSSTPTSGGLRSTRGHVTWRGHDLGRAGGRIGRGGAGRSSWEFELRLDASGGDPAEDSTSDTDTSDGEAGERDSHGRRRAAGSARKGGRGGKEARRRKPSERMFRRHQLGRYTSQKRLHRPHNQHGRGSTGGGSRGGRGSSGSSGSSGGDSGDNGDSGSDDRVESDVGSGGKEDRGRGGGGDGDLSALSVGDTIEVNANEDGCDDDDSDEGAWETATVIAVNETKNTVGREHRKGGGHTHTHTHTHKDTGRQRVLAQGTT